MKDREDARGAHCLVLHMGQTWSRWDCQALIVHREHLRFKWDADLRPLGFSSTYVPNFKLCKKGTKPTVGHQTKSLQSSTLPKQSKIRKVSAQSASKTWATHYGKLPFSFSFQAYKKFKAVFLSTFRKHEVKLRAVSCQKSRLVSSEEKRHQSCIRVMVPSACACVSVCLLQRPFTPHLRSTQSGLLSPQRAPPPAKI